VKQLLQVVRRDLDIKVVRSLLAQEAARALVYYAASEELLPLIDKDSRAALWVLVTIYRGLLERIMAKNYDVFSERVSVPTPKKLLILAQGMGMAVRNRMVS
jgi:phytoene synthase